MPAGSETFAAGAYTATWNSVALGIFEGDSGVPALEHMTKAEPINRTSAYGDSTIDGIYRGGDFFFSFVCLEYKAGPKSAWWPFSATLGRMGTIGRLYYDMSLALVLTVVAGTPAATTGPTTFTASKTILAPGFQSRLLYGPTMRKVPLRLQLLPYDSGGNIVWYTEA